jgi:hypothetical protein
VRHLVRARESYICESCVEQAVQALAGAPVGQKVVRIRPRPGRPVDRDDAEGAVEEAFETVFGTDAALEARCGAIERGANLAPTMQEAGERFPGPVGIDVSVEHVRFLSDDEAEVSFVLIFPGGWVQVRGRGWEPGRPASPMSGMRCSSMVGGRLPARPTAGWCSGSACNARHRLTDHRDEACGDGRVRNRRRIPSDAWRRDPGQPCLPLAWRRWRLAGQCRPVGCRVEWPSALRIL